MRCLALLLLVASAVPAVAGPPVLSGAAPEVALIDGWSQPDGSRIAGVEIRLAPGWHTYWRVPGAAGIPPVFDWAASSNLKAVAYEWPRPLVFESYGHRMFGYERTLVLPVRLTPKDPAAPMDVALDLSFGVCRDICMPVEARVEASLAPDGPATGRDRIEAALAERAQTASEAGVARVTCALAPGDGDYELVTEITFAADPGPGQVAVLEPGRSGLWIGESESRTDGRVVTARAPVSAGSGAGPVLDRGDLRVTVLDGSRAVDIRGCAAPG